MPPCMSILRASWRSSQVFHSATWCKSITLDNGCEKPYPEPRASGPSQTLTSAIKLDRSCSTAIGIMDNLRMRPNALAISCTSDIPLLIVPITFANRIIPRNCPSSLWIITINNESGGRVTRPKRPRVAGMSRSLAIAGPSTNMDSATTWLSSSCLLGPTEMVSVSCHHMPSLILTGAHRRMRPLTPGEILRCRPRGGVDPLP
mmetsp:Transcript_28923/g.35444  ORF Transcript_28923/g.35444 Transcript_28923/m.35444 type:complete len:203 (-) Transcript_28923:3-611(-)